MNMVQAELNRSPILEGFLKQLYGNVDFHCVLAADDLVSGPHADNT